MNTIKNPTLKSKRKPFSDILKQIPGLEDEATDAINDVVHAATETGKAAELTIKIKFRPVGGKAGQVELEIDVKAKLPAPARGKTLMFATPDNNLQRENPRQQTLDGLRTADQEAEAQSELRTTAPEPAAGEKLRVVGGVH